MYVLLVIGMWVAGMLLHMWYFYRVQVLPSKKMVASFRLLTENAKQRVAISTPSEQVIDCDDSDFAVVMYELRLHAEECIYRQQIKMFIKSVIAVGAVYLILGTATLFTITPHA